MNLCHLSLPLLCFMPDLDEETLSPNLNSQSAAPRRRNWGMRSPAAPVCVARLAQVPNVPTIAFDGKHYKAAEEAFERYRKGRQSAASI